MEQKTEDERRGEGGETTATRRGEEVTPGTVFKAERGESRFLVHTSRRQQLLLEQQKEREEKERKEQEMREMGTEEALECR